MTNQPLVSFPQPSSQNLSDDSVQQSSVSKAPGTRRRSGRAHQAILSAAAELLEETGYGNLTIEAIAAKAGVSKKTIYRWWSNKAAVVMEAYAEQAALNVPIPNTGSLRADLLAFLREVFAMHKKVKFGPTMASLVAEIQTDLGLAEAFRERFITQRRAVVRQMLERAMRRGELQGNLDLEVVVDALYGPIFYRLLVGHAPLGEQFAEKVVNQLMSGVSVTASGSRF